RDGADVTDLVGVEDPIDPGPHHLGASAPGFVDWASDVTVPEDGQLLRVMVPTLLRPGEVAKAAPVKPVVEVLPKRPAEKVVDTSKPPAPPSHARRSVGIGAIAIGAIAIGGGLYEGSIAK